MPYNTRITRTQHRAPPIWHATALPSHERVLPENTRAGQYGAPEPYNTCAGQYSAPLPYNTRALQ